MSDTPGTSKVRLRTIKIGLATGAGLLVMFGVYAAAHAFWTSTQTVQTQIPGETRRWKLEVVNATGEAGMGQRVADHLRRLGFDVVDIRTQRSATPLRTVFVDRSGTPGALADLQTTLELTPDRVRTELDRTLVLDVSVIVGNDIRTIPAFAAAVR
ncbi:MAG: LytR C-terminal domain-containing protein [Bacteroidota bacterium]